jgi:SAM-dependent methyltransferase
MSATGDARIHPIHKKDATQLINNSEPWRRYLTDYNEGLGLVYERLVLNDFLMALARTHGLTTVLEAPLYGMAGVSGINSAALAQNGLAVTIVDDNRERLSGVERIWRQDLRLPVNLVRVAPSAWDRLPFPDNSFDFAWEWAALWHISDPAGLLRELARVSRNLVLIAMPNNLQLGYWMRKWILEREFFYDHDESWTNMSLIARIVRDAGMTVIGEGVIDVPPWPDTVMPASEVLQRLGIRNQHLQRQFTGEGWQWSTMSYYMGQEPDLRRRVMKYAWLDHAPLSWQVKAVWAHHRYILAQAPGPSRNMHHRNSTL